MDIFGDLKALRERPIPDQAAARAARQGCRKRVPIDEAGPAFAEAMTEARSEGLKGENYYHSPRNPPYWRSVDGSIPQLWLRKNGAERTVTWIREAAKYVK